MSLPWVQVERDFLLSRAPELAGELGITVPHAAGLMLMLWSWCQARGSGEVTGRNWRRTVEIAAGWDGEREEFVSAIVAAGLVEDLGDTGRVRGLDRYDAARTKAAKDRERIAAKRALGRESQAHDRRTSVAATSLRHPPDGPATVGATSGGRDVRRQTTAYAVDPPVSPPRGDASPKAEPRPPAASNDELFGAGNSLQDALEQRWLEARGSAYAWDERRDGHATRRILQLADDDAWEVLRRWDVALHMRYPKPTSVADLARHWNAYAAPEETQGAKRAADVPKAVAAQEAPCVIAGCEGVSRGLTWGHSLCTRHSFECMDSMGAEPGARSATRWVSDQKGGAA